MVLIRTPSDIDPAEITPESVYRERRRFMQAGLTLAGAAALGTQPRETRAGVYGNVARSPFSTDETLTELKDVTGYNNFYEFGTGKEDPAANARTLKTAPWSVAVEGECARPGTYTQSLHKSWQ